MDYRINTLEITITKNIFKKVVRKIFVWAFGPLFSSQSAINSAIEKMLHEIDETLTECRRTLNTHTSVVEVIQKDLYNISQKINTFTYDEAIEVIQKDLYNISQRLNTFTYDEAIEVIQKDLYNISQRLNTFTYDEAIEVIQKDLYNISQRLNTFTYDEAIEVIQKDLYNISQRLNTTLETLYTDIKYNKNQILRLDQQIKTKKNNLSPINKPLAQPLMASSSPIDAEEFDFDYVLFEMLYRGSRKEIKKTFEKYLPYLNNKQNILDVGCGSGEFIELLLEQDNKTIRGIDLNREMVEVAQERGLPVIYGDAVSYLRNNSSLSLDAVFSSQVVEHLSNSQIDNLVKGAYKNLSENGIIIFETINPMALYSYVMSYPLDPTHDRLIHPYTLRFILESHGFTNIEILFSSDTGGDYIPIPDENNIQIKSHNQQMKSLYKQVFGCLDYAVIGHKKTILEKSK